MEIPYLVLLGAYGLAVLVALVLGAASIYHALRFGMSTLASYAMTVLYVAFVVIVIGATWFMLREVDWSAHFTLALPSFSAKQLPTL